MTHFIKIFLGFSINMLSSISLIQVNKYIYIHYGISNLVLTCLQFSITSVCLILCAAFDLFKVIKIPIRKMVPMALSFCGFVLLTNYSLQFNSIGTYQCMKALTLPGVLIILYLIYDKKYSLKVNLTSVRFHFLYLFLM